MRIRKKKWAEPELSVCDFFVKNPEEYAGNWKNAFKQDKPIYLEIGCGKGTFAGKFAIDNPDKNIIAVDIKIDMLGVGRRNIVNMFSDAGKTEDEISNVLLVNYNVEQIDKLLNENDHIMGMFINFCNPWSRHKHHKRRLTYPIKLEKYKNFLDKNGEIRFKTDDDNLFEDSLKYFEQSGYDITYTTYDLHSSDVKNNIVTEHEKMFSDEGINIKYCVAKQK